MNKVYVVWYVDDDEGGLDYIIFSFLSSAQMFLYERLMSQVKNSKISAGDLSLAWSKLIEENEIEGVGWIEEAEVNSDLPIKLTFLVDPKGP